MKSFFFFFYFVLFLTLGNVKAASITGKVTDEQGQGIAFVSVYVDGTSNATLTNDDGNYALEVNDHEAILVFQYLGYTTVRKNISVNGKNQKIDVTLVIEKFGLPEVVISANAEDPAYAIMRKLIANRENMRTAIPNYEAELYIKGMLKLNDAPDKILGNKIGNMSGILDSTRQGILYLSESQSSLFYKAPNEYKEVLNSSIVSGDDKGVSMNQFNTARYNFYEENITFNRELISPLSDAAFTYYKFRLVNSTIDERGHTLSKIEVIPKSDYRPCFNGELYVNETINCISSLNFFFTGAAIKSPLFDTLRIRQVHAQVGNKNQYALLTQTLDFQIGAFGFKAGGRFSYVFSNYKIGDMHGISQINANKNEIFAVTKESIKNDSAFWNSKRPIPLTDEETKDYIKKDSLKRIWESKPYLDSIDAAGNKFNLSSVLFGYSHSNSFTNTYWGFGSLLNSIGFNAVEGAYITFNPYYTWYTKDDSKRLRIQSKLTYGFSDQKFKPNFNAEYRYNRFNLSTVSIEGGRKYLQFNNKGVITPFFNSITSLFEKRHLAKVYNYDYGRVAWRSEVANGWMLSIATEIGLSDNLPITTNYSFLKKEQEYGDNLPNSPNFSNNINLLTSKVSLFVRWVPGQKYMTFPERKVRLDSKYPIFTIFFDHNIPLKDNCYTSRFTKMKLNISKENIMLGTFGHSNFDIEGGWFLNHESLPFNEAFQNPGLEILPYFSSQFNKTFLLAPYYQFTSTESYGAMYFEHHFAGLFMDKIPILRSIGIKTVASFKTLQRADTHYYEAGLGIEGFRVGIFELGRVDYIMSFDQDHKLDQGFKIGLSTMIESILGN